MKLSPGAKLVFLYLITNERAHLSGIYYLPEAVMVHEIGYPIDTLSGAVAELIASKVIAIDRERSIFWVRKMFRYQGRGAKNIASASKHLATLHNSPLIKEFCRTYPKVKAPKTDARADTLSDTLSDVGSHSSQEQEQEQEQEQKEEKNPLNPLTSNQASEPTAPRDPPPPPAPPPRDELDDYEGGGSLIRGVHVEHDDLKPRINPYRRVWREKFGGLPDFGQLVAYVLPIADQIGDEECLSRWTNYVGSIEPKDARFAGPRKFSQIHAAYITDRCGNLRVLKPAVPDDDVAKRNRLQVEQCQADPEWAEWRARKQAEREQIK